MFAVLRRIADYIVRQRATGIKFVDNSSYQYLLERKQSSWFASWNRDENITHGFIPLPNDDEINIAVISKLLINLDYYDHVIKIYDFVLIYQNNHGKIII